MNALQNYAFSQLRESRRRRQVARVTDLSEVAGANAAIEAAREQVRATFRVIC